MQMDFKGPLVPTIHCFEKGSHGGPYSNICGFCKVSTLKIFIKISGCKLIAGIQRTIFPMDCPKIKKSNKIADICLYGCNGFVLHEADNCKIFDGVLMRSGYPVEV